MREHFLQELKKLQPKNLLYLDEMGVDDNLVVEYGWSARGARSYAEQSGFKKNRLSIVAAYNDKKLIAPFEFSGQMNSDLFLGWFEQILCPQLTEGQTIIMDNASFHKADELHSIANEVDCQILFLPPYSPDLNPIEKVWANIKNKLRKLIKKAPGFQEGITEAMRETIPG